MWYVSKVLINEYRNMDLQLQKLMNLQLLDHQVQQHLQQHHLQQHLHLYQVSLFIFTSCMQSYLHCYKVLFIFRLLF